MSNDLSRFAATAEQAARAGGRVLMDLLGRAAVREKGPKDLVTQADTEAQRVVRDILLNSFPDHDFLGEEDAPVEPSPSPLDPKKGLAPVFMRSETGGTTRGRGSDPAAGQSLQAPCSGGESNYRWIVDPLDGTTNYVHNLPGFTVSIGLERGGAIVAGVVYDPTLDECFVASLGGGAFLNGRPLQTSRCRLLREAMVAASLSPRIERDTLEIAGFMEVLIACHSLRRLGSAALNLCYTAAGRLDAYWAMSAKVWDIAAGILIVSEAGGVVTDVAGSPLKLADPRCACSATPELHAELLDTLARTGIGKGS